MLADILIKPRELMPSPRPDTALLRGAHQESTPLQRLGKQNICDSKATVLVNELLCKQRVSLTSSRIKDENFSPFVAT